MRKLVTLLAVAAVSSAATAAVLALPALADGDAAPAAADAERPLAAPDPDAFRERVERFEQCMKDAGFDLTGDRVSVEVGPDGVTVNGKKVDADAFRAAQRECGPPFRGAFRALPFDGDGAPPALREHMERMRECMGDVAPSAERGDGAGAVELAPLESA